MLIHFIFETKSRKTRYAIENQSGFLTLWAITLIFYENKL